MIGTHIIINGRLGRPEEAVFPLDDLDATYGYGCYETLKIRAGVIYFAEFHEERLLRSASILGIQHEMARGALVSALNLLLAANRLVDANVKVLMLGREGRPADWFAFLLPPVIPAASLYRDGASCLLFRGERHFPAAKSLSMLLSTVAYRAATGLGCYDALLVNSRGELTEGTRTNIVYIRRGESGIVYTPPAGDVLEGITRRTLADALTEAGLRMVERRLSLAEVLGGQFALAVTSTSSRVIAIRSLLGEGPGPHPVPVFDSAGAARITGAGVALAAEPSSELGRVASIYDEYLSRYALEP